MKSGVGILRTRRWIAIASAVTIAIAGSLGAKTVEFNLETATIDDIQEAMDAGALTSVDLVLMYMSRIATYDQDGPNLNSVPALNPDAIREAAAADRLRRSGIKIGPLHGIPFVTKGNYAAEGLPVTNGLTVWEDLVSPYDCTPIARLRAAGAVFLGHANQDTFQSSASSSTSQTWGSVKNAYVPGYVSGGSSGGPATATAANFATFALGGETGGSVRGPSDRAGIVGYKTSNAAISVHGLAPLAWDRDVVGPMARYAKDNAYVMDALVAPDPEDIWADVTVIPDRALPSAFPQKAAGTTLKGKKIGVLTNFLSNSTTGIAGEINTIFASARAELEALGATVVEVTMPSHLDITFTGRRESVPADVETPPTRKLYNPVTSDTTGNMVAGARGYAFKLFLESVLKTPEDTQETLHQKVVDRIMPVAQLPQAARDAIANQETFGPEHPDAIEHFLAVRYQILDWEAWMASEGLDALVFPTSTNKTPTGNTSPGRAQINSFSLPLVTVPMGVLSTGEPTTIGFLGRFWRDDENLALAAAYEAGTKHRIPSPLAPPLDGEVFEFELPAAPPKPAETAPPVLAVKSSAKIVGKGGKAKLLLEGKARDGSGVKSVVVLVNGRKVPVKKGNRSWTASVKLTLLKKITKASDKRVNVTVIAKDRLGNTNAKLSKIKLPG